MTTNSKPQPRVVCNFFISQTTPAKQDGEVYTRISMDNGKVRLASSRETDAMGKPTNWQAIDIDGVLTADETHLAHATFNIFVLTHIKDRGNNTPVVAYLHADNSRIVVCGSRVICETA